MRVGAGRYRPNGRKLRHSLARLNITEHLAHVPSTDDHVLTMPPQRLELGPAQRERRAHLIP